MVTRIVTVHSPSTTSKRVTSGGTSFTVPANVGVQDIYIGKTKVRTDVIYRDPTTGKTLRVKGVTGKIPTVSTIRKRGRQDTGQPLIPPERELALEQMISGRRVRENRLKLEKELLETKEGKKSKEEIEKLKEKARKYAGVEYVTKKATSSQQFQKELFKKQGYKITKEGGKTIAVRGDTRIEITDKGTTIERTITEEKEPIYFTGMARTRDVVGDEQVVAVPALGEAAKAGKIETFTPEERKELGKQTLTSFTAPSPYLEKYETYKTQKLTLDRLKTTQEQVKNLIPKGLFKISERVSKDVGRGIKTTSKTVGDLSEYVKGYTFLLGYKTKKSPVYIKAKEYVTSSPTVGYVKYGLGEIKKSITPVWSKTQEIYKGIDTELKKFTYRHIPETLPSDILTKAQQTEWSVRPQYGMIPTMRTLPFAMRFSAGAVAEVREKPTKAIATAGLFFVGGGVAGKALSYLPKFAQTTLGVGLPILYGGTVAVRSASDPIPSYRLGRIFAGEIAPMVLGGAGAAYVFPRISTGIQMVKFKPTFRQPYKQTAVRLLSGQEKYYTAPQSAMFRLKSFKFDTRYMLPDEKQLFSKTGQMFSAYSTTPAQWATGAKVSVGTSEIAGGYYSTTAVPAFLKLSGSSYSLYGTSFTGYGAPAIMRQQFLGFKLIPKTIKTNVEATKFMTEKAISGYGYIPSTKGIMKSEIEAILKAGTGTQALPIKYYTRIPTVKQFLKFSPLKRGGQTEYIMRVKKFKWYNPKTYMDRMMGRKAGQIKYFGFKRLGRRVIIEQRILAGVKVTSPSTMKRITQVRGTPYSYTGKYPLLTPSSMAGATGYSVGKILRGYSYRGGRPYSYGYSRTGSYSLGSSVSRGSSFSLSSTLSRSSYGRSSGISRGSSYSISRGGSYSLTPSRGYSYGYSGSYGISRGSGYGYTGGSTIRRPPPFSLPPTYRRVKGKRKKIKGQPRTFKYTASIYAAQTGIKGVLPKVITGVSRRGLIGGV